MIIAHKRVYLQNSKSIGLRMSELWIFELGYGLGRSNLSSKCSNEHNSPYIIQFECNQFY